MLQFLFDTDHLTLYHHKHSALLARLAQHATGAVGISPVSIEEIASRQAHDLARLSAAPYDAGKEIAVIELTLQQCTELSGPDPVAIDPQTKATYVLVRRESYERMKGLLALDDYDPDEAATFMNEIMAEDDAKDPLLESYQHFGKPA